MYFMFIIWHRGAQWTSSKDAGIPQWAVEFRHRWIPGIPQIISESCSTGIQHWMIIRGTTFFVFSFLSRAFNQIRNRFRRRIRPRTDIFVRKPPERAIPFLYRSVQNLSKTVRKGMFPTGIFVFFVFFLSSWHIFFAKNQRDATFLTLQKNHLTPGVKALIKYLTFGNNVNIHFFM